MRTRQTLALVATALALALPATGARAQQPTGTVVGRVLESGTEKPLASAQVFIAGTTRGALTGPDGRYAIAQAAPGTHQVRVTLLGYAEATEAVTIPAGGSVSADFVLSPAAVQLDAVVVTGTPGATMKRAIGNAVATISAAQLTAVAPVTNVTQLLEARTPGLTIMQPSGSPGTAASIRIRGTTSVNAGNQPVFYVDGVRIQAASQTGFSVGGQRTSALDVVNPNDIESIEVIKGPAAATLYGADAAAGVIQIITKKGQKGSQALRWEAKVETGRMDWAASMPVNYTLCTGARIRSASWPGCAGMDSTATAAQRILSGQPLKDVMHDGLLRSYDLAARGGGERFSFYMGGSRDREDGIFPNSWFNRTSGRANFSATPVDKVDLSGSISYTRSNTRLANNDNSSWGWLRNAFRGFPGYNPGYATGWRGLGPTEMEQYKNVTRAERFILGTTFSYTPVPWIRNRLTAGLDAGTRLATLFFPYDRTGKLPYGATNGQGYIDQLQPQTRNWTLDYVGTVSRDLTKSLSSDLSIGMQFNAYRFESLQSWGIGLVSDSTQLVSAASRTYGAQSVSERRSLGFFGQEQIGYDNRLFLTAALRMDNSSVFGTGINHIFYPKLSASWVLSEEPWFHVAHVDNLRLRAAWGQAGSAPDPYAADRNFSPAAVVLGDGTTVPALRADSYGNDNLKAERGNEIEAGLESSLFGGRGGIELTYYDKTTRDALIGIPLSPSTGFGNFTGSSTANSVLKNVGTIHNQGLELSLTATPVRLPSLAWDVRLSAATNRNRFVSFNGARSAPIEQGFSGPDGLATQRISEGFPMGGYWARLPLYNDDGTPRLTSVGRPALSDTAVYMGTPVPTREASLGNTLTVLRDFRLYVFADYKGGHKLLNMSANTRDLDGNSWEAVNPDQDVTALTVRKYSTPQYIEDADFVKLREVSLTYSVPRLLARLVGAQGIDLTIAGRNLALWTKYSGPDPEVNINGDDTFIRADYMSVPALRRFVTTLNVRF